jgi:hypothetical protein
MTDQQRAGGFDAEQYARRLTPQVRTIIARTTNVLARARGFEAQAAELRVQAGALVRQLRAHDIPDRKIGALLRIPHQQAGRLAKAGPIHLGLELAHDNARSGAPAASAGNQRVRWSRSYKETGNRTTDADARSSACCDLSVSDG